MIASVDPPIASGSRAKRPLANRPRLFLVSQHYAPDDTSTARYLTQLSHAFAEEFDVTVLSGMSGCAGEPNTPALNVVCLPAAEVEKGNIAGRLSSMLGFSLRCFRFLLRDVRRGDRIFVVTTPAILPYFVMLAGRFRSVRTVLILYDLYPDVLVASGLAKEGGLLVSFVRLANSWLYANLDRIVVIGDDMKRRVEAGSSRSHGKTVVIPNWIDLDVGAVPAQTSNRVRAKLPSTASFVVGLSGNLGFVHDPMTVLRAARLLEGRSDIHFLLSGWGVGWEDLKREIAVRPLANATRIDRVPIEELPHLLSAADAWIIPYKRDVEGVSVPSRFYNLLALGKPIITLAGRDADHSRLIAEERIGWIVKPEDAEGLARVIVEAADDLGSLAASAERAVSLAARRFSLAAASEAYRTVARTAVQDRV